MRSIIFFAVVVMFAACQPKEKPSSMSSLAGMYKLLRIDNQDSAGNWIEDTWSKGGTGYILYDGLGHMAVHILPQGYSDYKWLNEKDGTNPTALKNKIDSMSADELRAAVMEFSNNYIYVANASINDSDNVITHARLTHTNPTLWNTSVQRSYEFKGDTLELHVVGMKRRVIWLRQQ